MHRFTQKPVNKHKKGKKKKDVEEMQHEIFTSNLMFLTKGHLIVQGLLDKGQNSYPWLPLHAMCKRIMFWPNRGDVLCGQLLSISVYSRIIIRMR